MVSTIIPRVLSLIDVVQQILLVFQIPDESLGPISDSVHPACNLDLVYRTVAVTKISISQVNFRILKVPSMVDLEAEYDLQAMGEPTAAACAISCQR